MSLFREIPPTAGLPIQGKDFLSSSLGKKATDILENDFKDYLGVPFAKVTYSGTAAFYIILESLRQFSDKKTVIIPSFICPLIPLAIARAGFKVLVCDINKDNFDYDAAMLNRLCSNNPDILAILVVHLAGIPVDLEKIQQIIKEKNIFIIEDCAQALGAVCKGKKVGTLGDFAFFSLCRGKGLTIYEGGVIIAKKKEYISAIETTSKVIINTDYLSEGIKVLELLGYWVFYRPILFWFVFRLPQAFWELLGKPEKAAIEYFSIDFPLHKVSGIRKAFGHSAFKRLDKEISKQRQKIQYYIADLKGNRKINLVLESTGDYSNYPYLSIIFDNSSDRDKVINEFKNSGLGISQIYLKAITDYDYLKDILPDTDCPNARSLAKRHITLSTSLFLTDLDLAKITERMNKTLL